MRWERLVARLRGISEEKRQFGGPSREWEGRNRLDIKTMEWQMWKVFIWARIRPSYRRL